MTSPSPQVVGDFGLPHMRLSTGGGETASGVFPLVETDVKGAVVSGAVSAEGTRC